MANIKFENYFKEKENKYYDSKFIIKILEDILGKSFEEIKKNVKNSKITVTKEQIENYLEQKLIIEDPELKKRIENPKPKRSRDISKWTEQDIEDAAQELDDSISIGRYCFDPYTLEYFNRYTTIVKNKVKKLLNIIEKISNKNITSIQDILTDLDIVLDENGNILKSDIIRLITPTIYNINELNEKISKANDFFTYRTFNISKHSLYRDGISEFEIYPNEVIQEKNLIYGNLAGNISLSDNQRKVLQDEREKSLQLSINGIFNNLFD